MGGPSDDKLEGVEHYGWMARTYSGMEGIQEGASLCQSHKFEASRDHEVGERAEERAGSADCDADDAARIGTGFRAAAKSGGGFKAWSGFVWSSDSSNAAPEAGGGI